MLSGHRRAVVRDSFRESGPADSELSSTTHLNAAVSLDFLLTLPGGGLSLSVT